MDARTTILIATLATNVLLAAVLAQRHTASRATVLEAPAIFSASHSNTQDEQSAFAASGAVFEDKAAIQAFEWAELESSDYKEYIANLRAFGVSERVIRDIIIADVAKLYRPRFAALRPPKKPANTNFWENRNNWYGPYQSMTREQREQTKALQKEQTELIKTLLGENVYAEMGKESGQLDWTERMFGKIPEESREKVQEMQERFQELQSEIYAKAEGMIDQDTQADLKNIQKQFRDELATVLTPEQVKDYELRSSDVANNMRWELSSFEPNEQEFRAIFDYKQAKEEFEPQWSPDTEDQRPTPETMMALQQKKKEAEDAMTAALGPDRLKEYKIMEDYAYRNLLEAGVAKESVFKIADMKTDAETAANKIRQDKTLTGEQRTAALQAIRVETEKTLATLVGDRRARAYSANGGWWLRNIAPKE